MALPVIPAFAGGSTNSQTGAQVVNGQVNLGNVWTQLNVDINNINGSVDETATAAGNAAEIFTMTDSQVSNDQYAAGAIGSRLTTNVSSVGGDVSLGAFAVCNTADISTDPNVTAVQSSQICNSNDPSTVINANVHDVGGSVAIAGGGVGNQLSIDSNAASFPVDSFQSNPANIYTTVNANVANVGGNVSASASAVGNTAQIVQYNTGN